MGKFKYLILGQGIAGTALAHQFSERNIPFKIVDDGHKTSSSQVAAGLWNPIVFRRINKTWRTDELLPAMDRLYGLVESKLNIKIRYARQILRMHGNKPEADFWMEKRTLPGYQPYLLDAPDEALPFRQGEYGSGVVDRAGFLDIPLYLTESKKYFQSLGSFKEANCEGAADLAEALSLDGDEFEEVIDCRGYRSGEDPAWSSIGFKPTKGEVLTVKDDSLSFDKIFNAGFFLLGLGSGKYRLGATFEFDNMNSIPTSQGRDELLEKLEKWYHPKPEVVDHKAGIRPTVKDRKPLVGTHGAIQNLHLFNGMGAKGVMLVPFLAENFIDYLETGSEIIKEVNISRYFKRK